MVSTDFLMDMQQRSRFKRKATVTNSFFPMDMKQRSRLRDTIAMSEHFFGKELKQRSRFKRRAVVSNLFLFNGHVAAFALETPSSELVFFHWICRSVRAKRKNAAVLAAFLFP